MSFENVFKLLTYLQGRVTARMRDRDGSSTHCVILHTIVKARIGPDQNQELGSQSRPPVWTVGAQALEVSSATLHDALTGSWIETK